MSAPETLESALRRLDVAMRRADPEAHAALAPPATDDALRALAAELGAPLPAPIEAVFRWHDGAGAPHASFDGSSVHALLSSAEVIATRRFLLGPENDGPAYPPGALPLLSKGNGDYVSFVLAGPDAGRLFEHRHDDAHAPPWRSSLLELVLEAADRWEQKPARTALPLIAEGAWRRADSLDVATMRAGDAIAICTLSMGMRPFWDLYVQVDPGEWVWGFSGAPDWLPEALATAARAVGERARESSAGIARTVASKREDIAWTLAEPPARAPSDLSMLGVYVGVVRRR